MKTLYEILSNKGTCPVANKKDGEIFSIDIYCPPILQDKLLKQLKKEYHGYKIHGDTNAGRITFERSKQNNTKTLFKKLAEAI